MRSNSPQFESHESDTAIDAHGFLVELVKGNHIHETP
ncbi:hypothetical protein F444_01897 [Phytophthora nicotianae P1976]|uniref:Uncharacterized protein n=1 Tax=Phytophthora nicotianae P1976 TaxID=1317066 RepID=A0A081AZ54_PHYNI|nr:hypothetical protein F444_01897 [Phytophthora nicotianae P1976]